MDDFGVIVVCSEGDYIFAKGCCASVKYFMPDVPLCVLVDGNFNMEGLPEAYNAIVLKRENIRDDFLREKSFGWGITKMIAFWESPFKRFLLIDADTNVWGDMRIHADFDISDFIIDLPDYKYSTEDINKWFFNTDELSSIFPEFRWIDRPFVCTGVIFGKRDTISLNRYRAILQLCEEKPGLFEYAEMGFLNYLFFSLYDEGIIRLKSSNIQYIACDYDSEYTGKKYLIGDNEPFLNGSPVVIHWPGDKKPVSKNPYGYYGCEEPMRFFRKQFLRDSTSLSEDRIEKIIRDEETARVRNIRNGRIKIKFFNIAKSLIKAVNH